MEENHIWIENHAKFEAVLVCKNELRAFEKDTTIRAFQTYQFTDATTAGDEPSFAHIETGTIIRHDGNILAIDFGEDWSFMLPDLILTLSALGWTDVEVYHPAETMNLCLTDIGRAIPANVSFDVHPAQTGKAMSEFPEAISLLERGRQLTQTSHTGRSLSASESAVILAEMKNFDSPAKFITPSDLNATRPTGPILLDDDDLHSSDDKVRVAVLSPSKVTSMTTVTSEEPAIFQIPVEDVSSHQPTPAPLTTTPTMETELPEPLATVQTRLDDEVEKAVEQAPAALPEVVIKHRQVYPASTSAMSSTASVVTVGKSMFFFDDPRCRLVEAELQAVLDENAMAVEQVVHIYPGTINEPIRWDVLGELTLEHPWVAERVVGYMQLQPNADTTLVSSILLAMKKSKPFAGLRDVLMFLANEPMQMATILEQVSPTAAALLKHAEESGSLKNTLGAIVHCLGALALAPVGEAFVDLVNESEATTSQLEQRFTIREVLQSTEARAYIVHIDELDSPFVEWLVVLLRNIAKSYGLSQRHAQELVPTN